MTRELLREDRLNQLRFLEEKGINPYPGDIPLRTHMNAEIVTKYDQLKNTTVSAVGRLRAIRDYGGRIFADIEDGSGKVQTTLTLDNLDEETIQIFRKGFAVGDFIGVSGEVLKTRANTVTVDVKNFRMLAKSLLPAPFQLKDVEVRSRQRYLDMLVNPEVRDRFVFRSKMVEYMRQRFLSLDCHEMETPILDTTYGGATAKPFITKHNALGREVYMRIANELYLKRLVIGGIEGVYEFSRDFRNEGEDNLHSPEFTQVELYKAYVDYNWMMDMAENLMCDIAQNLLGKTKIEYQGKQIDLKTPWRRLSIYDGVREVYGIDPETITDSELKSLAKRHNINKSDRGDIILDLFEEKVAPTLINPTFVIDFPESTSPLTKKHRFKAGLVERFECVVAGMEVMNCYTELNDPRKQRANFQEQLKRRAMGDEEAMLEDEDFIISMEYGMPPMGGIGISIDRWTMLYKNLAHIRESIAFPLNKPEASNNHKRK